MCGPPGKKQCRICFLKIHRIKQDREGEKLQVALLLIKQYEDANYPVPLPDPIEVIKLKMKDAGLRNKDLVGKVGGKGYIFSILSGRKSLTLDLAKSFHRELNIPAEVLLS